MDRISDIQLQGSHLFLDNALSKPIFEKSSIIVAVHRFGYKSLKDVNEQFNQCMVDGGLFLLCKVLCWTDEPDGHHSDENEGFLENKCDKCLRKSDIQIFIMKLQSASVIRHIRMIIKLKTDLKSWSTIVWQHYLTMSTFGTRMFQVI